MPAPVLVPLLAPLRAGTWRRTVHLLLGGVILLPYVLLAALLVRALADTPGGRTATVVIALVAVVIAAVPPFLGGTRELEIAAARSLLGVDLPVPAPGTRITLETRLRAALWFAVHLAVGAAIGGAVLLALPMALIVFTERLGLTDGALAGLRAGFLGPGDLWAWTLVGVLLIIGTVYAAAGLGALAATMAPVLLGPSQAERGAAAQARERALAERNRLARELHDSVGHALTAATLQAAAARAVFDSDPAFARRALAAIEEVGRAALDDLDHVLGALREADEDGADRDGADRDGAAGNRAGPDGADGSTADRDAAGRRAPQPTLADLGRLCDGSVRLHGDEFVRLHGDEFVRLHAGFDPAAVPAAVSREAYRIVQEGLTNAGKHGGGPVTLRVTAGDDLAIEMVNPLAAGGSGRRGGPAGGRGLAGMRERVRLLGGSIEAGPGDGRWRVTVRLPL